MQERILKLLFSNHDPESLRPTLSFCIGFVLLCLGGLLRYACYRCLGNLFTFELSVRQDHRLVTCGPYSVVRHPSYTALCLCCAGLLTVLFGGGSYMQVSGLLRTVSGVLVSLVTLSFWIRLIPTIVGRTYFEDRMMKDQFGEEWEEWARNVRWRLVPGLF
ncbi:hypothetical protein K435DRAFT_681477 [Dendrothele bispora CBS 962.96]|uniref:Protein-S-isoprenylcysteine O-methyltransferase n=1 Tax=Dendrothele bispora (strain CBS 962.96) TaxID=1314807 RepID=A0A4V4HDK0_DENBC|nr:hypothetical protein K435DRAFT_681477 [Dendrothele bispora CBS 962.96]